MEQQLDLFDVATTPVGRGVTKAEAELPPQAREILILIGAEALIRLVNSYGGVHIDFPRHARFLEASKVVQAVGDEIGGDAAMKIARHFAGQRVHIPRCVAAARAARNAEIRAELDRGEPAHVVARRHKMTERQVWNIAKKL